MLPLGRNHGCYQGERLHIGSVVEAIRERGGAAGFESEWLDCPNGLRLLTLTRKLPSPRRRCYLSAGIHGDEPAGPMALLELLTENAWPEDCEFYLCPCLNPIGFERNTRENGSGRDLNRDYRHPSTPEIQAHTRWLERQPGFDMGIHLHEDWEARGFYLYELNPAGLPSRSREVIEAVTRLCPIDPSEQIEGWPAEAGVIRPSVAPESREDWPEAFFMVQQKTRISYTLESPSDFQLPTRVTALKTAVKVLVN